MIARDAQPTLLSTEDGEAVEIINPDAAAPLVLACEHASNRVPVSLDTLGLTTEQLSSHIAWDPGAREVALKLSATLDAPLVASRVSRLVFDCNRPPLPERGIATRSDAQQIPGNQNLSEQSAQTRIQEVYTPFHASLESAIVKLIRRGNRNFPGILVTIHSFTQVFLGQTRTLDLGILHDQDARLADFLLSQALGSQLNVRRNEPYGPKDGVTHTLQRHGLPHNLLNVMIEIRNDLIATPSEVKNMAGLLAQWLDAAIMHPQW